MTDALSLDSGRHEPAGIGSASPGRRAGKGGRLRAPRWFLLPALIAYGFVMIYPSLAGAFYAFTDWRGRRTAQFIGLDNFVQLLGDHQARASLANTLTLAVVVVTVQTLIGLSLALALSAKLRTRTLLRTLFFIPVVLPSIIVAVLWRYLYVPGGPIDTVLEWLGLGSLTQSWLGDSSVALGSVIATIIWQNVGLTMVIYLAGIERIPVELYEAASIDGASAWSRLWNITLPLLAPATTIVITLSMVGSLKLFDQVFVMTGGGPGYATETLSMVMYRQAFVLGNYGYGTAIALVLTLIVAVAAYFQLRVSRRFEVEE